jgi:hypothetical protein
MNNIINELEFNNDKKNLKKELDDWFNLDQNKKIKLSIKKELETKLPLFKKDKKYYRDLIFYSKNQNIINELDIEIIFCNGNPELVDIWKYFKVMSSSSSTSDDGFGNLKMMLKDKNTNKYLGILEISCDIISCLERDNFIGWTKQNKFEKIQINNEKNKPRSAFLVNITCCIGLQPMSYNLNIGKLLVATVFSKEVLDYFYNIRGYYYAGVTTFGLYGKSIQYDRLKEIKYIGETNGTGTCEIPTYLYEQIRNFVKKHYEFEYLRRSKMSSSKMRILQFGLNIIGFNQTEILTHGKKRGIYFGYTSIDSKDFFNGKKDSFILSSKIKSFNEITNWWKERWAKQRFTNLLNNNRLKIAFELKDFTLKERKNEYAKQYQYEKFNDEIWLKHKKKNNLNYYYENKDKILEEIKINFENYRYNDQYIYPEYLGGFFDSDGSIYISKDTLFIGFTQCVLSILLIIQKQYGGTIFKRIMNNKKQRDQYTLRFVGLNCKKIIQDLVNCSVLKVNKLIKGLEFINYINLKNTDYKNEIIEFIRNNKKEDNIEYFNRINWKYFSGFFDGDGCITLNYPDLNKNFVNPRLSIAQKYTPFFLSSIKNFLLKTCESKIGTTKYEVYSCCKKNIYLIFENIKNYIVVKKYQYEKMIDIFEEYKKNKDIRDNEKIKILAYEIKNNKHQHIDYELNIEKNNIITSMKTNIIKNIEKNIDNKIQKETYTKIIQSDKKTGLNNPNYGYELSNEHSLNISVSTTNTKRAGNPNLTNEKIREIYDLKDTMMQKDVAEKYNMNREMIRRIWNKTILPTDDKEFLIKKQEQIISKKTPNNNELTHEQKTSLGKRNFIISEYIDILKWKLKKENKELIDGKKIFSTTVSEYLSKLWNKKVTNDVIKNIWSGKTKLFEFEFNNEDITYQEYLDIIAK